MSGGRRASSRRASWGVSPVRFAIVIVGSGSPRRAAARAMPWSGARRLRSTSYVRALRGETYSTRTLPGAARVGAGDGSRTRRSRHHRKAARVLPLPVGAWMRVWCPAAIAAQPPTWAAVRVVADGVTRPPSLPSRARTERMFLSCRAHRHRAYSPDVPRRRTVGPRGGAICTVRVTFGTRDGGGAPATKRPEPTELVRRLTREGIRQAMSTLRRFVTPLAAIAAAIVLYIEFPFDILGLTDAAPSKELSTQLAVVFWVLAIVVVLA